MSNFLNLENPYSHLFWNRDQFNARNRAVITTAWDLPFGKGRRWMCQAPKPVETVLGGWQAQTVHYFQGGQYFSPRIRDPIRRIRTPPPGYRQIADGNLDRGDRNVARWFDASGFTVPPAGRFGNSGVNVLEGPGLNLHHLAVTKNFKITERWKVVYQASINNIFNRPHYNFPQANISVPAQVGRLFQTWEGGGWAAKSAMHGTSICACASNSKRAHRA